MFIHFEFLTKGREANVTQAMVSTPNEACNLACVLQSSDQVVAWKMLSNTPTEFGWGTQGWTKLRLDNLFREEDWKIARGD